MNIYHRPIQKLFKGLRSPLAALYIRYALIANQNIINIPNTRLVSNHSTVSNSINAPLQHSIENNTFKEQYHVIADRALDNILSATEKALEKSLDSSFDVEVSSGVLTVDLGPNGVYVINKQPYTRQIWLSSPKSGPWRFDLESASRKWISSRGSVDMISLLESELTSTLGFIVTIEK